MRGNESSRHLHQWRLDVLSIPNYVIKKVRPHGNRHGKTEEQTKHFIAHNFRKGCIKKDFEGIHDRIQKDLTFLDAQLNAGRTEEKCIEKDDVAQKDSPIACRPTSTLDTKRIGGSLSTHLDAMHR